jgi:hypothetical protein
MVFITEQKLLFGEEVHTAAFAVQPVGKPSPRPSSI